MKSDKSINRIVYTPRAEGDVQQTNRNGVVEADCVSLPSAINRNIDAHRAAEAQMMTFVPMSSQMADQHF
jgi:hypothetical protein